MGNAELLEAFGAFAGPERFNEFLDAIGEHASGRRRLRYWQEKLWTEFAAAHPGVNPSPSYDELEAVFRGQGHLSRVLGREEFLADPSRHWLDPDVVIQPGWVADAWGQDQFRRNMTYLLVRSVSKVGSLELAGDAALVLAAELNEEHVAALYSAVLEESGRREAEWRTDFERIFAAKASRLPPPSSAQ